MQEQDADDETGILIQKKAHILRNVFFLFICIGAFVSFLVFLWFLSGPSQGTLVAREKFKKVVAEPVVLNKKFSGKNFSFEYPEGYRLWETEKDSVSLEKVSFRFEGSIPRFIVATVREIPGKTLEDIPGYQMRNDIEKEKYVKREEFAGGKRAISFLRTDEGYERTVFIQNNNLAYSISVHTYGSGKGDSIEKEYQLIMDTLSF